jgi:hypothetical protein
MPIQNPSNRPLSLAPYRRLTVLAIPVLSLLFCAPACGVTDAGDEPEREIVVNLSHLDHLGERIDKQNTTFRIIHIYSEAPNYGWVADPIEGAACVDDAARAAVVYLRHFQLTGTSDSRVKAEELIRFLMYMQREDGLFYNFVHYNDLTINRDHPNSRAEPLSWWTARGVWALGVCAEVLATANPAVADACQRRVRRTFPHLEQLLVRYGDESNLNGRRLPNWLIYENASDATSELLLGLNALQRAGGDASVAEMIDRFAGGLALMQYGSMRDHPWGAHASWRDAWHGWGNAQTQALAEAGHLPSAVREAEHFYSRLLVEGWMHSFSLDNPAEKREFEQIAYAVRGVSLGLVRLYEATGDSRYAVMAGLAASWFTGNNVASAVMYDEATGRGYDGINGATGVNRNAGAESTIEALYTLMEINRHPEARAWLRARGESPASRVANGKEYRYRIFEVGTGARTLRMALVMNTTDETLSVLEGDALADFLR